MLRDSGASSAQTAGCGHKNPARATGFHRTTGYTELLVVKYSRGTGYGELPVPEPE